MRKQTTNYLASLLAFMMVAAVVVSNAQAVVVCMGGSGHQAVELSGHSHENLPVSTNGDEGALATSSDCSDIPLDADEVILSRQELTVPASFLLPASDMFALRDLTALAFDREQRHIDFESPLWLPALQQLVLRTCVLTI